MPSLLLLRPSLPLSGSVGRRVGGGLVGGRPEQTCTAQGRESVLFRSRRRGLLEGGKGGTCKNRRGRKLHRCV